MTEGVVWPWSVESLVIWLSERLQWAGDVEGTGVGVFFGGEDVNVVCEIWVG